MIQLVPVKCTQMEHSDCARGNNVLNNKINNFYYGLICSTPFGLLICVMAHHWWAAAEINESHDSDGYFLEGK